MRLHKVGVVGCGMGNGVCRDRVAQVKHLRAAMKSKSSSKHEAQTGEKIRERERERGKFEC